MRKMIFFVCLIIPFSCMNNENEVLKLYLKGNEYFYKKDLSNAREYFEQAIKKDSSFLNAYLMLSKIYYYQKNFANAKEQIDTILDKNPDHVGALYWNARILVISADAKHKKKNDAEAIECLKKVVELDGHHIPGRALLALIYEKNEKFKEALYEYQMIIQEEETIVTARANLGILYHRLGLKDKSSDEMNRAMSIADTLDIDKSNLNIIKREMEK